MKIICPFCKREFKKFYWKHYRDCHSNENYESTVLKLMNLNEWPVYEIDGIQKKFTFVESKWKFSFQSVSDASKVKTSERFKNPDAKLKHSESIKLAYKNNPEYRRKVGASTKKRFENPDERRRLSDAVKSHYDRNPEDRKWMAKLVSDRYEDPEYSKKCSEAIHMSRVNDPTIAKRISETLKKRFESEEAHIKASESHKKMHADNPDLGKNHSDWMKNHYKETGDYLGALSKEYRDKHMNNGIWTSGAECKFITVLKELGYEVIGEGTPLNTTNSKFFADALIKINDTIIDVEIDGPWCHDNRYERDIYRDTEIHESFGYKIFRLNSKIASYLSDRDKINAVLMDVVNNDVYYKILTTKDLFTKWRDSKIKLIDVVNSTDHTV